MFVIRTIWHQGTISGWPKSSRLKFIYSEKATKSPPIIWLAVHRTNNWWRFWKILWPSQNIWTLPSWTVVCFYFKWQNILRAINESLCNQRSKSLQLNVSITGANYVVMRLLTTACCLESNRLILKKQNICHHFLNKAIGFTYLCTYLEFRCTVSVFSLACFLSIPSSNICT